MISVADGFARGSERGIDCACLHELFEAQASRRPDHIALVCGETRLSYAELDCRANQLAHHLRRLGVGPGKLVGLYFDRSERPIIAILAVLKAGAGYVPIDPVYPPERARHILTEASIGVLLTEVKLAGKASTFFDETLLSVDKAHSEIAEESPQRLPRELTGVTPRDLSYILYTSGSTGRPKGVMAEHRNVVRFADSFNDAIQLDHTDRVFQGFSLCFDGSVEELWMAFSNGATLVVGTSDVVKFGEEVAKLFEREGVTVFSTVPTFLSMIGRELPSVRLIIVSGEPCPPDLVNKWALPSRRMLNVYGPTETTVNTTVAECSPDRPVTIGRPLRGYDIFILDDQLKPVAPGEPGELYIGGVGLARGYFNQPELTAKQFVPNPFAGTESSKGLQQAKLVATSARDDEIGTDRDADQSSRLYRTGDLVTMGAGGELHFHRRMDRQVKIRGFRIELSEIESVLRELPQVRQAVVNVFERGGLKELAAYVVTSVPHEEFDRDNVLQCLRDRLPPYMVPGYMDLIDIMPTLASGKADRSRLPEPRVPLVSSNRIVVKPETDLEYKILEVWQKLFKVSAISCEDDFFLDLGGYSLLAAQLVTLMRSEHNLEVSIRDVYGHSSVRRLAAHVAGNQSEPTMAAQAGQEAPRRSSREVFESVSQFTRWTVVGLQAVSLCLCYGAMSLPLLAVVLLIYGMIQGTISLATLIVVLICLLFFTLPAAVLLSVATKWLVIGRFKAGEYPVWSFYYFRWWLVTRVLHMSGVSRYVGSPLMSFYFRMMGAKIGRNCIIDTPFCAAFDLLSIGDDTSIGAQTQLLGYYVEGGMLVIGRIEIGNRCFIGIHSALGLNTKMGDDSCLDDMSLLPDGAVMAAGESRRGSPAEPADVTLPGISPYIAARRRPFLYGLLHFLASEIVGELLLIATVPALALVVVTYLYLGLGWAVASMFAAIPFGVVSFCMMVAWMKRLIMPRTETGVHAVESVFYLRKWSADLLLSDCSFLLSTIFTTIYLPPWLRLMGAKIGKRAEISTVTIMTPDLMDIDDESFFADGSMVGGRRFFRGHVQFEINHVGKRSFVGNNALLPLGANLGDNCLLGVLSAPPGAAGGQTPDGTEWLGSPPFELPHRHRVGGFDVSETFHPTLRLYLTRCIIDAIRIVFPIVIDVAALIAFAAYAIAGVTYLPLWAVVALAPVAAISITFAAVMSVVVMKRLLMGTFAPVIKPLWSVYVWLNECLNGAYEALAVPLLAPLLGTPFINWYLRRLGCKIGRHVFMETELFSEFDLVEVGDYAALNFGVVIQNHLFEDRIMKSSRLRIGDECSVGNMSVVLYDTEMQQGSSIGPMSLLMKGETLPPNTKWIGIPTSQVKGATG